MRVQLQFHTQVIVRYTTLFIQEFGLPFTICSNLIVIIIVKKGFIFQNGVGPLQSIAM